jgi:HlyD family secretion protein
MADQTFRRVATEPPATGESLRRSAFGTLPEMPAPAAKPPEKKRSRWLMMGAGLVVVAVIVWVVVARRANRTAASATGGEEGSGPAAIRTASVARGEFVRTVRLNGTTEAIQARPIAAPRLQVQGLGSLVITHLVASGTRVKKGELLVEFDRQAQIKSALDRRAEYLDFLEQIKKKKADQAAALARDQSELAQAEHAVGAAQLEVQRNEIVSKIDAEKNLENLEEARARFSQLRETFDLKRKAAEADLRVLEIQRDRALNAMRHAEGNADKLAIRSPMDGMAVLNTIWKSGTQGEVQEGDEIRAGVPFMQVIDPSAMQVRLRVNQADVPHLRLGQAAQIRMDAYPDLVFPGRLEQLAAIGATGSFSNKVRTFVATFSITGSHPKLLPDLSAAVDVEIERRSGAIVVPRDAVFTEGNQRYVRVGHGGSFEKRAVKIGALSDTEAVIESGLDTGAVVQRAAGSAPAKSASPAGSSS